MTNRVKLYRTEANLTQTELAEKAELSLRTIQRIETGTVPKGHTLRSIAKVFNIAPKELLINQKATLGEGEYINKVKIINISALSFLIIPFWEYYFSSYVDL